MSAILLIITRISGKNEWQDTWGFDPQQKVAFVSNKLSIKYNSPENTDQISLVIVRGDDTTNLVSTILNLIRNFDGRTVWLLIHPGGGFPGGIGSIFSDFSKLSNNIPPNVYQQWQSLRSKTCEYSIGGCSTLGQVVEELAQEVKKENCEAFTKTLSDLLGAYQQCECITDPNERTKTVADKLIRGKIPWRYEYFLELSQRLLDLNTDYVGVIKEIVGGEGGKGQYEQNCNLTPGELKNLQEKIKVFLGTHNSKNLITGGDSYQKSYDEIYCLLLELAKKDTSRLSL